MKDQLMVKRAELVEQRKSLVLILVKQTQNFPEFIIIKQVFVVLLSFSESLETKYVSLNKEANMIRPLLIDLNPIKLNYYPFMISLDKLQKHVSGVKQKTYMWMYLIGSQQ